jgi:hypothetical protein
VSDQEGVRDRKVGWPTIVLIGLAIFGAISAVQLVIGLVFSITRILVLVGIVAVLVLFFRGPPDGDR